MEVFPRQLWFDSTHYCLLAAMGIYRERSFHRESPISAADQRGAAGSAEESAPLQFLAQYAAQGVFQ
jgi:hypothetical protein